MLRHWGFAVFLLTVPIPVQSRPTNAVSHRQRRAVSHAQMMHDRSRSMHEQKRMRLIQKLLEQVHTAWDSTDQSEGWPSAHRPKHAVSAKNFPLSFAESLGMRDDQQETSKSLRYEEQPLKAVSKRKRKMCLGRRRERGCGFHMQMPMIDQ